MVLLVLFIRVPGHLRGLEMSILGEAQTPTPSHPQAGGGPPAPHTAAENKLGSKHRSTRQLGQFRRNQSGREEDALPQDTGWATP